MKVVLWENQSPSGIGDLIQVDLERAPTMQRRRTGYVLDVATSQIRPCAPDASPTPPGPGQEDLTSEGSLLTDVHLRDLHQVQEEDRVVLSLRNGGQESGSYVCEVRGEDGA